jgi:hypothetical protein
VIAAVRNIGDQLVEQLAWLFDLAWVEASAIKIEFNEKMPFMVMV